MQVLKVDTATSSYLLASSVPRIALFSLRELASTSSVHPNPWHDTLCHHKPPYIFPQNSHHTYLSRNFHSLSEIYCHATSTFSRLDLHVIHVPSTLAEAYICIHNDSYIFFMLSTL